MTQPNTTAHLVVGSHDPNGAAEQMAVKRSAFQRLTYSPYTPTDSDTPRWFVYAATGSGVQIVLGTYDTQQEAEQYVISDPDGILA